MPNPFERMFEPGSSSTPFGQMAGTIGQAFGMPSQQERYGSIQGRALKELSELQASTGGTPQQTLTKFMQTPTGMDLFTSGDPSAMNVLQEWAKSVTAPTPTITGTGPGNATYETGPGYARQVGQVPPTNVQEFTGYAQLSKLPPEKIQELAQQWMIPQDQRTTAEERAIKELIASGGIDAATGQKILGKVIQVKPVLNAAGENTGNVSIIDLSTGQATVVEPQKNAGQTGAATPTKENPLGIKDPDKVTMFLGSGPLPTALGFLDSLVRSYVDPSVDILGGEGAIANSRARYLKQLHAALTLFPEGDGKTNMVIKEMQKLGESGAWTDNLDATRNGIKLYDMAQRELAVDEKMSIQAGQPKDQVVKAGRRIEGYRAILRALPEREDMVAIEKKLLEGTAGAVGAKKFLDKSMEGAQKLSGIVRGNPDDTAQPEVPAGPTKKPAAAAKPAQRTVVESAGDDIATMPVAKLLQLDPATLPMDKRKMLLDRIQTLKAQVGKRK